jgi:hypothetical protein
MDVPNNSVTGEGITRTALRDICFLLSTDLNAQRHCLPVVFQASSVRPSLDPSPYIPRTGGKNCHDL